MGRALARTLIALVGLCAGCADEAPAFDPNRPKRVVVIVVDTLRADRLAPWGGDPELAPFLNHLAERSLVFERAYSTSSWTAPATASLFTSLYPFQHGVVSGLSVRDGKRVEREGGEKLNRLPPSADRIPRAMKRAGYSTFGLAANLNVGPHIGFDEDFDRFHPFAYDTADAINGKLREWRDEILGSDHAFCYVHYMDPHQPYHLREGMELSPEASALLERVDTFHPRTDAPEALDPGRVARAYRSANGGVPRDAFPPEVAELLEEAYDSEVRFLDERLRELFELLELERDAVVILTADHGEEFGEHGGTGHGFHLYSELVRVPLLVYDSRPGAASGRVDATVSLIDVLPTLRELTGLPVWEGDQGSSLLGIAAGAEPRTLLFSRTRERPDGKSPEKEGLVHGRHKWIRSDPGAEIELYDLDADPAELSNLAGDGADALLDEMASRRSALVDHAPRHERVFSDESMDASEARLLEMLGYAGDTPTPRDESTAPNTRANSDD